MITQILLERPWLLLSGLIALQVLLSAIWRWKRTRAWAISFCAGLATIPILLLVNRLVLTSRERVIELCTALAAMVEREDLSGIASHLTEDFAADGLTKVELLAHAERALAQIELEECGLRSFQVAFSQRDRAVATFNATCRVRIADDVNSPLLSRWELRLHRQDRVWCVTSAEVVPTAFSPIRRVRDCLR